MAEEPHDLLLFTYGTLQRPDVQLEVFGRVLGGSADWLLGYRIDHTTVQNTRAIDLSGTATHAVARPTGNRLDRVPGLAQPVTENELDAADEWGITQYRRAQVVLASGRAAWVYVAS